MIPFQDPQQPISNDSSSRVRSEQYLTPYRAEPRRILIINDEPFPDLSFSSNGIVVEVTRAPNIDAAIKQLDEWAKSGQVSDIVTIDCHQRDPDRLGHPVDVARDYIAQIQMWKDRTEEHLHPKKLFLHSFSPDYSHKMKVFTPPEIGFHSPWELHALVNFADNLLVGGMYGSSPELRRYMNSTWETALPESPRAAGELAMKKNIFDTDMAWKAVREVQVTPFQAVLGIAPNALSVQSKLNTHGFLDASIDFDSSCGGAAVGGIAFDEKDVKDLREVGKKVILVVKILTPDHLLLLSDLVGVVALERDTLTQHSPIILNAHNVAGLFGVRDHSLEIASDTAGARRLCYIHSKSGQRLRVELAPGDPISIGDSQLFPTSLALETGSLTDAEEKLATWSRELRAIHGGPVVMANADTPAQVANAIQHGAAGIGLVRTEHMFFTQEGLGLLRSLLLNPENETALQNFSAYQKQQCKALLIAAKGSDVPITIRLLDAPPEEFLNEEQLQTFRNNLGGQSLRGLPFALKAPGVYQGQLRALFEALHESRFDGELKVMIPLVHNAIDLASIKGEFSAILAEYSDTIDPRRIKFGSMIETRGAIDTAGEIAKISDFVSFGTKDLTFEIVGIPRSDVKELDRWMREHDTSVSPYQSLCEPVREAIKGALAEINSAKEDVEITMCGEHVSGDFESIKFCHKYRLNGISVNPTGRIIKMSQIMLGKLRASNLEANELAACDHYPVSMLHDNLKTMRAIAADRTCRKLPIDTSLVYTFISTAASLLCLPELKDREVVLRFIEDVEMNVLSKLSWNTRATLMLDVFEITHVIRRQGVALGELRSEETDIWWHDTHTAPYGIFCTLKSLLRRAAQESLEDAHVLSVLRGPTLEFKKHLRNAPEGIHKSSLSSLEELITQLALIIGDDVFSEEAEQEPLPQQ